MPHIAIIGAGITGVTTAYALLKRGYRVTVFERHRYPAMETSFANGGQLSASNAEVWNRPATILHGLQWILRRDAPLLFNLKPSWHKYCWIAEFIGQIRNYNRNTAETVRLALLARKYLFAIADAEGIQFDLEKRGILHFYRSQPEFAAAGRANEILRQAGLERFAVTPGEMRKIEPTLHGNYSGGFFTPADATGDIHQFTRGLAASCASQGGLFLCDTRVVEVEAASSGRITVKFEKKSEGPTERQANTFDGLVVCAGVESRKLAAALGDRINIYPVKGYSISVYLDDQTSQAAAPTVSLLDDSRKIVTSRLGAGRFRVAGTAEFNGFNRDIRDDRIRPLVKWTRDCFPDVSTDRVVPWSGLRPMTPNMMPRVGPGKKSGIFYNTGHGHLGWTLAAATAEIVAEQVTTPAAD